MSLTIFKQTTRDYIMKNKVKKNIKVQYLLMLLTQQIIHGLHRIESRKRHFNEYCIPITHRTVPQAGKLQCFKVFAVL